MKPMMQAADMPMGDAETPAENQAEGGQEEAGDLSKGYCVEIHVMPDGTYSVVGPEPLDTEEEKGEVGDSFTSLGEALKDLLARIKANPVGSSDQASFEAGYNGQG